MDPEYGRPQRAGIQVRHATKGGNPLSPQPKTTITTTESDEREVGNTREHAAQTAAANKGYVRGNPVNAHMAAGSTVRGQNGFEVVEQQDGVEIPGRILKTAAGERAKQTRTTITAESARSALLAASNVSIEPGQGISQEEMMERMTPEERETYLAKKEMHRSKYVVDEPPSGRTVVASVRKAETKHIEGISLKNDVGHGIEIADPTGTGGKPRESVIVEDGITFRTTNGPERDLKPQAHPRSVEAEAQRASVARPALPEAPAEVRKMIAKAVCADFPDDYNFALPVKKRMARLQADYEDRPDVLRAVFSAESDEIKAILMKEFPAAFSAQV
jgi:hypothetical protein